MVSAKNSAIAKGPEERAAALVIRKKTGVSPYRILFYLLILSCTFDKAGIPMWGGGHGISISLYKTLLVLLLFIYVFEKLFVRRSAGVTLDRRLFRLVIMLIVIQTAASFCGMCLLPGDIRLGSEIYYFIQNIQIACIPLLAARFNLSPKSLLKLFSWAILLQYLALTLQLLAPQLYFSILGHISDPLRPDNSYLWDRNSLVFYGLQRTGNYGTFVAGFGLLALAFRSKHWGVNFLIGTFVLGSAIVVCLGQARAVFIMCALALIVFVWRGRIIGVKSLAAMPLLASLLALLSVVGLLNVDRIPAIHAFSDPEKEGSNEGKLMIAQYGLDLFKESPIIGWGHRPFSEISSSVGNTLPDTSQTHSQVLAIVLSSGLVGLFAYLALYLKITAALLTRGEYDYSIVCGIFVGLGVYNIVYDAGGLDVFACFNGVAGYYALRANSSRTATFPRTWRPT